MTAEQRRYLKSAIDAHRRAALAADGDRKFRYHTDDEPEKDEGRVHPLTAIGLMVGMTVLLALALFVEHLAR